jgi:hypothetical protein
MKNKLEAKGLGAWLKEQYLPSKPEFKPQYHKNKKKALVELYAYMTACSPQVLYNIICAI